MKEHYFRFAIGLKEGKVAVKFRFSVTVVDGVHNHNFSLRQWAHNDTRGWKANLQEIGFQMFTVTCVSVSRVSRWHTSKMYRWLLKLDTHTTMNIFFPFFSGMCRQIIADALNGTCQGTLKGCASD